MIQYPIIRLQMQPLFKYFVFSTLSIEWNSHASSPIIYLFTSLRKLIPIQYVTEVCLSLNSIVSKFPDKITVKPVFQPIAELEKAYKLGKKLKRMPCFGNTRSKFFKNLRQTLASTHTYISFPIYHRLSVLGLEKR